MQARIFVNDLDSICVGLALARTGPTALPLSALLGVPFPTVLAPAVTLHRDRQRRISPIQADNGSAIAVQALAHIDCG
ncbi:hypothetical protein [Methylobacterium sp. SD21]|uniref:hypothetical protein n=1 Tax=Methylobacterium litchii TaxID=3138810 RepID=UPI00313E50E2